MKRTRSERGTTALAAAAEPGVDRRGLVVAAGVAGAAALAAVALHRRAIETSDPPAAKPKVVSGDGYQLTDHVLRYYQTARS